jgi:hypothetical protein
MNQPDSYVIGATDGFSPEIGRLVGMMSYARFTTLRAVDGLSVAQLDHLHDERSNTIASSWRTSASRSTGAVSRCRSTTRSSRRRCS